jgi:hypothetical protein
MAPRARFELATLRLTVAAAKPAMENDHSLSSWFFWSLRPIRFCADYHQLLSFLSEGGHKSGHSFLGCIFLCSLMCGRVLHAEYFERNTQLSNPAASKANPRREESRCEMSSRYFSQFLEL